MTSGDSILVTGAAGFVGSAVARAALARGMRVRALVRATSDRRNLAGLDAQLMDGDMRDEASMARACAGMRYVIHVAADYRLWAPDARDIERNNLAGARAVMRAVLGQGVERVVYTSSVATLKVNPHTTAADETRPLAAGDAIGAYKRSKVLAEQAVLDMVAREGLPAVIVNPSTPIGARDVRPTPTGRIIVEAASGKMPAFVDTGLNLVGVDDVAEGHLRALERGRIGERYILGGDNVTLQQMLGEIAALVGRRAPRVSLPRWPLYPLGLAAQTMARFTGREPFITVDGLRMSKNRMFFTSDKAQRELGYSARPYAEGLAEAIAWFKGAGYLK